MAGCDVGSVSSLAVDAFAEADLSACCELPWPGVTSGSVSSLAVDAFAEADLSACCELPWPGVASGSVSSLAVDAFAEADLSACCELPWPALLPGASPVSRGSATATGATIAALCMPNSKSSSPAVECALPCPVITTPVFAWTGSFVNVEFSWVSTVAWP